MNNAELIQALSQFPPDATVFTIADDDAAIWGSNANLTPEISVIGDDGDILIVDSRFTRKEAL